MKAVPLKKLCVGEKSWSAEGVVPTLNVRLDRTEIECEDGRTDTRSCNLLVFDEFFQEHHRAELLNHLTEEGWDHNKGPPQSKWERSTADGPGLPTSWGLKETVLSSLLEGQLPALQEINARLTALYPEYQIYHQPSNKYFTTAQRTDSAYSAYPFVGNAPVYGEDFRWHVDADPSSFPPCPWIFQYGSYVNHEPGKPLFVSMLIYLCKVWPRHFGGETLFLDDDTDTGILVRPKPFRMVLMDQDLLHRISAPSRFARQPRYTLVWKLLFFPKAYPDRPCSIAKPHWRLTSFGSMAGSMEDGNVDSQRPHISSGSSVSSACSSACSCATTSSSSSNTDPRKQQPPKRQKR
eukprot:g59744.t1